MKKLLAVFLITAVVACDKKKDEPTPNYAENFVGEYWTNTADGKNTSSHTWVVTSTGKNTLNIDYTINYVLQYQGKEIKSTDVYKLTDIQVLNPVSFKINQDAELSEDGKLKTRHVEGEAVRAKDTNGNVSIGITFKLKDPGSTSTTTTDFLEFKKK